MGRYVDFVKKLLNINSPEVSMVCNMVARCARSTSRRNLVNIQRETHLDHWVPEIWRIREVVERAEVPAYAGWRVQYIGKLLDARRELETKCEIIKKVNLLIDGLCNS